MPFSDIKTLILEMSGRHDLVSAEGATFLNMLAQNATMYLDLTFGEGSLIAESWYKKDIAVGSYMLEVPGLRSVSEVKVTDSDGESSDLVKKPYKWIKEVYPKAPADLDRGTPFYYAMLTHRLAPAQRDLTSTQTIFTQDKDTTLYGEQNQKRALYLVPPADDVYTVSVKGTFFSVFPEEDNDTNYWIDNYPTVFAWAILRELEIAYRNFEGERSWTAAIVAVLLGIDKDEAEESSSGVSVMEG